MIVAHAGGWDELAFVLIPIAVVILLVWLANRFGSAPSEGDGDESGPQR